MQLAYSSRAVMPSMVVVVVVMMEVTSGIDVLQT
jgi:hypothetical protein